MCFSETLFSVFRTTRLAIPEALIILVLLLQNMKVYKLAVVLFLFRLRNGARRKQE